MNSHGSIVTIVRCAAADGVARLLVQLINLADVSVGLLVTQRPEGIVLPPVLCCTD